MIGSSLQRLLVSQGYKVIILTRKPRKQVQENVGYAAWDVHKGTIDHNAIASADHILHLAGAGVADKRWTKKRKEEIVGSRIDSSRLLIDAMDSIPNKVQTVVSASAIGWYGPDPLGRPRPFIESDPPAAGFLGDTCRRWEESIQPVSSMGKRLVILRTSIVLSREGGAFPQLTKTLKGGIASIMGDGKQTMSWIHVDDICRMYLFAIRQKDLEGVYNAAAPEHISNKDFILRAAKVRGRPFIPVHVPVFALKLVLGELSVEVLKSATVDDARIRNTGFKFIFAGIDAALNDLIAGA